MGNKMGKETHDFPMVSSWFQWCSESLLSRVCSCRRDCWCRGVDVGLESVGTVRLRAKTMLMDHKVSRYPLHTESRWLEIPSLLIHPCRLRSCRWRGDVETSACWSGPFVLGRVTIRSTDTKVAIDNFARGSEWSNVIQVRCSSSLKMMYDV